MTTIGIFFVFVIPIWLKMTTIGNFPKSAIPSKYGRKYKNFIPYFLEENTRILFQEKKQFAKLAAAIQWRLQILHPLNPHNNITCEQISRQHAQRFTSLQISFIRCDDKHLRLGRTFHKNFSRGLHLIHFTSIRLGSTAWVL